MDDVANKDNILVRGVNWIGDAVMTMPALRALRKAYPGSDISLLVRPSVAPLFDQDPDIDSIIPYADRFRSVLGRLKLAYSLRRMSFSKAILLQNAFDAALIAFLAGVPERIGYRRDGRGRLLTKPVPFHDDDRKLHHIYYYLNLLAASGIPAEYSRPFIHLSLEERLGARKALSELRRPLLGINPGAAFGSAKRWVPGRFADIAAWHMRDSGGSVVIFGGKDEKGIAHEIAGLSGNHLSEKDLLNTAGRTGLRELIAMISECDAFVTNDSGPMHISYAVGAPLVAIFGSTDPRLTGPVGSVNVVIKSGLSCSPCFERTCRTGRAKCMEEITAERVYAGLKNIMPSRRAVFFDRDGTLCKEAHYLNNWKDFEILPGLDSLRALRERGFALIGVSNQSGIYRGIVDEPFVKEVNRLFIDNYGFDDFLYCPHGPDEHCSCRKPQPGMILEARERYRIDPKRSFVVGDKDVDMLLAKTVGACGILVKTGQHLHSENADFIAADMKEAVGYIISHG